MTHPHLEGLEPLWHERMAACESIEATTAVLACINDLNEALAAMPGGGVDGWLPIETAPKDGTRVLVCCMQASEHMRHRIGRMAVDGYDDDTPGGFGMFNSRHWPATHWRPLNFALPTPSPHEADQS